MARDRDLERNNTPALVAALVLVAILVVFVFQNTQKASIRFLAPRVNAPLWVALFASMVVGVVVGFLLGRNRR